MPYAIVTGMCISSSFAVGSCLGHSKAVLKSY